MGAPMTHHRTAIAAPLAALLILAACQTEPEKVGGPDDPQAEALKNAAPVELPPSIKQARSYRCRDNSLLHVTFMSDDVTALVRDKEEEPPRSTLKAPTAGQPFVAEGYSLSGSGETVTYKSPDAPSQSCHT